MSEKEKQPVKYTKYQQGDVVMYRIEDDKEFDQYKNSKDNNNKQIYTVHGQTQSKAVFAFGEVTGHTHRVEMSEMLKNAEITMHMGYNDKAGKDVPESFQVKGADVELQHEEHDTITLPPGNYVVKIVREFNHITRRAQYVAD